MPVRQWLNKEKIGKATARQRVNARVMALSAGRWDIVRPLKKKTGEELLEGCMREYILLSRETFGQMAADEVKTWREALDILSIWEYTGRVRRGYFIEGMSGAQFIGKEEYGSVTAALDAPDSSLIWLNASDPAQPWGKCLKQPEGREFLNLPGTAVALLDGLPAAVFERQGRIFRIFSGMKNGDVERMLKEFVKDYRERRLFPEQKRLIVKEFPDGMEESLRKAGFLREMQDYVLYI